MDVHLLINLIVLVVLLVLSAFFSSAETALTMVSRLKMETLVNEGGREAKRAARVLRITDNRSKMLSVILIGNNLVNIFASALATVISIDLFGSYAVGIATGILTILVLIFGEITPKSMAAREPNRYSMLISGIIAFLMWLFTPLVFILNILVEGILRLFGGNRQAESEGMTSQELRVALNRSHEDGTIEDEEHDIIDNVFDFKASAVKEVMTPRIDITPVNIDWSYEKLMSVFSESMYTRYPVYGEDTDKVIGIINVKDLLLRDVDATFLMTDFVRDAYFTYEQKNISDLFEEMRTSSVAMAIVLDEYGALAGLVTLEDILEELVGEIRDEFDGDEEDDVTALSENTFEVLGAANLDDVCDELGLDFSSEDYDTIGGFLTGLFDHFPRAGETYITEDGVFLKVLKVKNNRVHRIRIIKPVEG